MRSVAVVLAVVLVASMSTDAFLCTDGCRQASSAQAADDCNATGACPLCTGAIVQAYAPVALEPLTLVETPAATLVISAETISIRPLDHPPRLA